MRPLNLKRNDSVAQLVEQMTLNHWVVGSIPTGITKALLIIFRRAFYFYPMPFTYILYSQKLDKYYVGSAIDKEERLVRHNFGTEKFTSTGIPWRIVYFEEFASVADSRKREYEIKKKKKIGRASCRERV